MYQSPRMQALLASGLRQYSLNIQVGRCGLTLTAMSPSLLGGSGLPSWSITSTSKPGDGLPIEPGFTSSGGEVAASINRSGWPLATPKVLPRLLWPLLINIGL